LVGLRRHTPLNTHIWVHLGGFFDTRPPTRVSDPTYVVDGITHYCVPNLPSLVARSATYALSNAILPYVSEVASAPLAEVLAADPTLARGVNVLDGQVTHWGLAMARDCDAVSVSQACGGSGP
jgi:alanine dehydrogenase